MEIFTARMQATLTLILVAAFIALLVYDPATADALKEFVGLAVTFWLLRQRTGANAPLPPPPVITPAASDQPQEEKQP